MSTNKKRFTVLNEYEILAEVVKEFPCLYHKSCRSHRERNVVRNAWVEVAKKLDFLEDSYSLHRCLLIIFLNHTSI